MGGAGCLNNSEKHTHEPREATSHWSVCNESCGCSASGIDSNSTDLSPLATPLAERSADTPTCHLLRSFLLISFHLRWLVLWLVVITAVSFSTTHTHTHTPVISGDIQEGKVKHDNVMVSSVAMGDQSGHDNSTLCVGRHNSCTHPCHGFHKLLPKPGI